jgi:flagellar biosynthesis/type III secretory pathway M-ring protein FliF/YscJ
VSTLIAAAPALPLHSAGKYVAAAYIVFVVLLLVYVTIMAVRLARTERDVAELNRDLEAREAARVAEHRQDNEPDREPAAL